jgi:haloalkane dehalogenase
MVNPIGNSLVTSRAIDEQFRKGGPAMDVLRTPDGRFEGLPEYDFTPHYADLSDQDGGSLRVHYVDKGPNDGPVVLLLHGEPSWSFLYRHMVPVLTAAGLRAIAPDLVGFGRSDKPTLRSEYT